MPADNSTSSKVWKSKDTNEKKLKTKLTEEERLWVIGLQEAMRQQAKNNPNQNNEDLGIVTEWDIATHAILAKNQPQKALHRLRRMKKFREQYKIPEQGTTVYEAIQIVNEFIDAHPNFIQAMGQDSYGRWVIFFKLQGLVAPSPAPTTTTKTTTMENNNNNIMTALYYILHALQPDLDAVRKGTVWVGDFENMTRETTIGLSLLNGARSLCRDSYPIKVKDFPCLQSPPKLSPIYIMCRPFLSQKLVEKMVLDCSPQLLQKHFPKHLLSRELGGTQTKVAILDMLEANLQKRFENHEHFRLNIL